MMFKNYSHTKFFSPYTDSINIMRKFCCYTLILLTCTACFNPFYGFQIIELEKKIADQRIVLSPVSIEKESDFYALMDSKDAYRIGAPNGAEYSRLLEERVIQEERMNGHKLCQSGYEITNSSFVYAGIWHGMLVCKKYN